MDLGIQHGFKDDLAGFLRREWLERKLGITKGRRIERFNILVLTAEPPGELRQFDVQCIDILVSVLGIHLYHERVLAL